MKFKLPYRRCVGIMVINEAGDVWMGRRPAKPRDEVGPDDKRWQMPQGGIDKGEKARDAAVRELWEETGIRSADLVAKTDGWLTYDLPDHLQGVALKGKYRGQKQKWLLFRFNGTDSEINIAHPPKGAPVEFDLWEWVPIDQVADRIVAFKRGVYERVVDAFRSHTPRG